MAKVATNYRFTTDEEQNVRITQTSDPATLTPVPTSEYNVEAQEADAVSFMASGEEVVQGTGNARKLLSRMIAMKANAVANMLRDAWDDVPAPLTGEELKRANVAHLKANGATDAELVEFLISGNVPARFTEEDES